MRAPARPPEGPNPGDLLLAAESRRKTIPIWLVRPGSLDHQLAELSTGQRTWLAAVGFKAAARRHVLVPGPDGSLAGVVLGLGAEPRAGKWDEGATLVGLLPQNLPHGVYHLAGEVADPTLAAVSWGLGAYRFRPYKTADVEPLPALKLARDLDRDAILAQVEAVWLGRDLINTPANDMGPVELEAAAMRLAERHGAKVTSITGEELLAHNFPLIHAVGRASPRPPRLIDITAGRADAPKVTLIGKGISFDTGGLDIKPSNAMLLMKKDMGGAATALALTHLILAARLDVRLRVLIPAAENSVSGASFRPGDVIRARSGATVEIGNTDAEGRLVLADALSLADEETPHFLFTFATLTGAARVALGPEISPFFCTDDQTATQIATAGAAVADAVWRLPLETPYETWLDSAVGDMNNVAEGGFAGSIVAAIFLKRFVAKARCYAHFDIYGWRTAPRPLGPKGGEPHAARAVFEMLRGTFRAR